jgi:hypothetical protein
MTARPKRSFTLCSDRSSIDYVEFLELIEPLTEEQRETVEIRASAYSSYGDASADLEITYEREMTDEEIAADAAKRQLWADEQRQRDLAQLAALKARLGQS